MSDPSNTTTEAWVRLVRAHHSVSSGIESALKKEGHPPLIWYDVLLELEKSGENGLRPYELEQKLLLRQYGVSRLIERMATSGHLKSETCEDDGRGRRLTITSDGKELRRRMWSVYGPAIQDAVGSRITSRQAKTLSGLLVRLIG